MVKGRIDFCTLYALIRANGRIKEHSKKELTGLKARIDATDREIDQMVYRLYGLTEDEIKAVEQSTK